MFIDVRVSQAAADAVAQVVPQLVADKVASRIFAKDASLWGAAAQAEAEIRLGWVTSPTDSQHLIEPILQLRSTLSDRGVSRIVLCGMGGSSLAPEVITQSAGVELVVLDSTEPEQVAAAVNKDLEKTAVVVSSKSGSTVETDSQKRAFEAAFDAAGIAKTERIVIVTDPGSPMEQKAKQDGYQVFNADPTVGGRYSALTAFGLVPSGLAGVDIAQLLEDAAAAAELLAVDSEFNPGLLLGASMARTSNGSGVGYRDKVGIIADHSSIVGFGDWAEQLIAESTGKENRGVLPVVLTESSPESTGSLKDMLLVEVVDEIPAATRQQVAVSASLGAQFLLWEFATAVAGRLLEVNPFDQPDVESAKIAARGMLEQRAAEHPALFSDGAVEVRSQALELSSDLNLEQAIAALLAKLSQTTGYISIHAYLDRHSAGSASELRDLLARRTGRPVTFGWGPRFLHSTGQYHKGGPKQGVFLQLTAKASRDFAVPGRDFSFGELISSQAAGDANVLAELGLPVLRLNFTDVAAGLAQLKSAI